MALLRRRKIDTIDEKRIVTGMIASTPFMHKFYPMIHDSLAYFQTNYTETLAKWALKFYEYHEEVPFEHIQDEFNMNRTKLSDEDVGMIHDLLVEINQQYVAGQGKLNVDYMVDQAERWCRLREAEITNGNVKVMLDTGDINGAEAELARFRKVRIQQSGAITGEQLFSTDNIYHTFQDSEEGFFKFAGNLGPFLGDFDRGWLVGLSGAFKRGKTWVAQEFFVQGILQHLNVAFFSLEMNDATMQLRIWKRLASGAKEEGSYLYPVFDCLHNQTGDCNLKRRVQQVTLLQEDGKVPEFAPDNPYRVCTVCREKYRTEYEAATWYEVIEVPKFDAFHVDKVMGAYRRAHSHQIRLKTYPRFTANVSDIVNDLNMWEQEGFFADIIIVDYADILKPEDDILDGVQKEDRTWIALAQLASERRALVLAPTQVNKAALEAILLKETHTARWVGKLAHIDAMLGISQTEEEKRMGRIRLNTILHRHREYDSSNTITVIQKIAHGQVYLDADFVREVRT
ncbi:MAG: hypothetical protein AM326_01630 [Candidatus Thorarchaeota archaeon SMTZ-45]|nr:MAG: hypothetical protein AM326_01630 [Candidatus Thorarchaeota archaeon SMTZ-45]